MLVNEKRTKLQLGILTFAAMLAFAANSILCRLALSDPENSAAGFTAIRIASGAAVLATIAALLKQKEKGNGNLLSSFALFAYAIGFSFAYRSLSTASGALLLFGAVQATMIGYGLFTGERLRLGQRIGLVLAIFGLTSLLFPGLESPPILGSLMMLSAGVAWGIYTIRGRNGGAPTQTTSANFLLAVPFAFALAAALGIVNFDLLQLSTFGIIYAIASGGLASGVGYSIWYTVVPHYSSSQAATIQLSVPVIAACGGLFLGEALTLRLCISAAAILGGVALVLRK